MVIRRTVIAITGTAGGHGRRVTLVGTGGVIVRRRRGLGVTGGGGGGGGFVGGFQPGMVEDLFYGGSVSGVEGEHPANERFRICGRRKGWGN